MALVTRVVGNKAAVYTKPTSGDPLGPFTSPGDHLDKVFFHSDLDFYRVALGPTDVTVTLPQVNGSTRTFEAAPDITINGQIGYADVLLLSHGLGYEPNYLIVYNNAELINGDLVQTVTAGPDGQRNRYVTHWCDNTGIYIRSCGISSASALPSMSFSCKVVVFKQGVASGADVFDFDDVTGRLTLGKGMFKSDEKLLRAQGQAGDTPYDIQTGRSIDIVNGASRIVRANGTVLTEPNYTGSFTAPLGFQGVIS